MSNNRPSTPKNRTRSSPRSISYGGPLTRQLAILGESVAQTPLPCFGERLARLFDLSNTVALDTANVSPSGYFRADMRIAKKLHEELQTLQHSQRNAIEASFSLERLGTRYGLPKPHTDTATPPTFEPYRRFYQSRQRQLAAAVPPLRLKVRSALTDHSPELARLAQIDAVVETTLAGYSRRGFNRVADILEKRFQDLCSGYHPSSTASTAPSDANGDAWRHRFHQQMKQLLLAELETRLEPVQGLLDALEAAPDSEGHHQKGPQ